MNIDYADIIILFCVALQTGLWDILHSGKNAGCQGAHFGKSSAIFTG